jgi:hypothetical protein
VCHTVRKSAHLDVSGTRLERHSCVIRNYSTKLAMFCVLDGSCTPCAVKSNPPAFPQHQRDTHIADNIEAGFSASKLYILAERRARQSRLTPTPTPIRAKVADGTFLLRYPWSYGSRALMRVSNLGNRG